MRRSRQIALFTLFAAIAAAPQQAQARTPRTPTCKFDSPIEERVKEGDIIAHTSKTSQSALISLATGSKYTHMGIITKPGDDYLVLEAAGPVRYTCLNDWIRRGRGRDFSIARLKEEYNDIITQAIEKAKTFIGRPYDKLFHPDDDRIYCSEIIADSFDPFLPRPLAPAEPISALLESIGQTKRGRKEIEKRWPGGMPSHLTVTPQAIMDSPLLEMVYTTFR